MVAHTLSRALVIALVATAAAPGLAHAGPSIGADVPGITPGYAGATMTIAPVDTTPTLLLLVPLAGDVDGAEGTAPAATDGGAPTHVTTQDQGVQLKAAGRNAALASSLLPGDIITLQAGTARDADELSRFHAGSSLLWNRRGQDTGDHPTMIAPVPLTAGGSVASILAPQPIEAATPETPGSTLAPTTNSAPGVARTQGALATPASTTSQGRFVAVAATGFGLLAVAGGALYHRIRPSAALQNDTRKSIFDIVSATPGLGVQDIAAGVGVSYSTATYHLDRLAAARMIVVAHDRNKLRYYKNGGAFTEAERTVLPILKNQEAARVLRAILESPGTYRSALADRLGVTATTINWHLRRLLAAELVTETRAGRSAYLHPNAEALRCLMTLAEKIETSDPEMADLARKCAILSVA